MRYKLLNRVLWQLNRSPLRFAIKRLLRLAHTGEVGRRVQLARDIPPQAEILIRADQLIRNGYTVMTDIVDVKLLKELDEAAKKKMEVAGRAAMHQSQSNKAFWTRLLDEDMVDGKLPVSNPFVRFATQPAVTGILARAFGEIPRLDYVLLTLSHHLDSSPSYSQLWHRDHDDVRVIKLFTYLSDVEDASDGPFTFLPGEVSDRFGYTLKSHRNDEEIFGTGKAVLSDVKEMIAPSLSVFMIETSRCLHMGSRLAPGHTRLLYTATYATVPCMFPGRKNRFHADIPLRDNAEQALLDLQ